MRSLLVVGALAAFGCRDRAPEPAVIAISTTLAGADPLLLEREAVKPIEDAVASIEGIRAIRSRIDEGLAIVSIEVPGADLDRAMRQVRDALETVQRRLPKELDQPVVTRLRRDDTPVLSLAIRNKALPITALSDLAHTVARTLERTRGVGVIKLRGVVELAVVVRPDLERLAARNVTISELATALRTSTLSTQVGSRVAGPTGIEDLSKLVIRNHADVTVRLADVAQISLEAEAKPERGEPLLEIHAQHGVQTSVVVDEIRKALPALSLPVDVTLDEVTPPPQRPLLVVAVRGPDVEQLGKLAEGFAKTLRGEIVIDPPAAKPEIRFTPDRKRAADLGITIADIASTIGAIAGLQVGSVTIDGRLRHLTIRVTSDSIEHVARGLRVRNRDGALVPLETLATATNELSRPILRHDRERAFTISVRGSEDELDAARKLAGTFDWPVGYRVMVSP